MPGLLSFGGGCDLHGEVGAVRAIRVLGWTCFCVMLAGLGLLSASLRGGAPTAPVWLSSAVIMAVTLRGASSATARAGIVVLGAVVMGSVGLTLGRPPVWIAGTLLSVVLEIGIGVAFLRNLKPPVLGASGFLRLVLGASLIGPLVSTAAASVLFALVHADGDIGAFALRWFAAHALGMMTTAPVLLSLGAEPIPRNRAARLAMVQAAVFAVTLFAFTQANTASLVLIAPLMALAVFVGGEAGAALALGLTGLTAALLTAAGFGPKAGSAALYIYQGFLACLAVGAHALVAVMRLLEGYSLELGEPGPGLPRRPAE
jgi:integral membrane sensor domain MASE1